MPYTTETYIRRAERDDLDTVVRWMECPDFLYFLYGDPARSPRQVREKIVGMLGRAVGHTMPGGIYLMVDSPKYGAIGLLSLQNISWRNRSCSIDLYIGQEALRNKMVTASAL
ncbi:MAG: GNAT family N-acetyltransferase, partial [Gammaproteobacteria bacterium]|nr:GNAT family N-acetyltransferase [Gammaproteobacteria bacterium]